MTLFTRMDGMASFDTNGGRGALVKRETKRPGLHCRRFYSAQFFSSYNLPPGIGFVQTTVI